MAELFALLNLPTPGPVRRKLSGRMGLTMALGNPKTSLSGTHLYCGPLRDHSGVLEDRIWTAADAKGTVAIYCSDLASMVRFYKNVLGLKRVSGSVKSGAVTLRNTHGYCGHTALVFLYSGANTLHMPKGSTLPQLSLSLPYSEQEATLDWFDHIEYPYQIGCLSWVGWCSVTLKDPEGNAVELISIDARS